VDGVEKEPARRIKGIAVLLLVAHAKGFIFGVDSLHPSIYPDTRAVQCGLRWCDILAAPRSCVYVCGAAHTHTLTVAWSGNPGGDGFISVEARTGSHELPLLQAPKLSQPPANRIHLDSFRSLPRREGWLAIFAAAPPPEISGIITFAPM
jgi:hypothetical protein